MKKVHLTQGKFAIVDDIDFEYLMQWKWYFDIYARRRANNAERAAGLPVKLQMHDIVLKRATGLSIKCRHINDDVLDNRRVNLKPIREVLSNDVETGPKRIQLTQGKFALVDECDFEYLMRWVWYFGSGPRCGYAIRSSRKSKHGDDTRTSIYMHKVIMLRKYKIKFSSQVDHKDGNRLNNLRNNLRFATHSQQAMNRKSIGYSKFKGVSWNTRENKWYSKIKVKGVSKHIGCFDNPVEVAKAYNPAAIEYFGEFAKLNDV